MEVANAAKDRSWLKLTELIIYFPILPVLSINYSLRICIKVVLDHYHLLKAG